MDSAGATGELVHRESATAELVPELPLPVRENEVLELVVLERHGCLARIQTCLSALAEPWLPASIVVAANVAAIVAAIVAAANVAVVVVVVDENYVVVAVVVVLLAVVPRVVGGDPPPIALAPDADAERRVDVRRVVLSWQLWWQETLPRCCCYCCCCFGCYPSS